MMKRKWRLWSTLKNNKILKCALEITNEVFNEFLWFLKNNAQYIMLALRLSIPFFAVFATTKCCEPKSSIIVVIIYSVFIFYADNIIKKMEVYNDDFPVPEHRFTNVDENDVVTCKSEEMQEIILYLSEVENYLERKGRLKDE